MKRQKYDPELERKKRILAEYEKDKSLRPKREIIALANRARPRRKLAPGGDLREMFLSNRAASQGGKGRRIRRPKPATRAAQLIKIAESKFS